MNNFLNPRYNLTYPALFLPLTRHQDYFIFSLLLHGISRRLTLLHLLTFLLMVVLLPINLLALLTAILNLLARPTLEQPLGAALCLLTIANRAALTVSLHIRHRAAKLENVLPKLRMLLPLLARVRRLNHLVKSARLLVKNEPTRHGRATEYILHGSVEAIWQVRIKAEDVPEGASDKVPHVVDLVLAVVRRVERLLEVGCHGRVLGEFLEQGLVIGCVPGPEVVRIWRQRYLSEGLGEDLTGGGVWVQSICHDDRWWFPIGSIGLMGR